MTHDCSSSATTVLARRSRYPAALGERARNVGRRLLLSGSGNLDGGDKMVEPVSLTLGAIVASFVAKAADKGTDEAVGAGVSAIGRLVGWLRERFASDDDGKATEALALVEKVPDSPSLRNTLAEVIDRRASDVDFAALLRELVEQVQASGVNVTSVTQVAHGDQNVQAAGSQVTVTYGAPPAPPGR